jgi:hypothetical protein
MEVGVFAQMNVNTTVIPKENSAESFTIFIDIKLVSDNYKTHNLAVIFLHSLQLTSRGK